MTSKAPLKRRPRKRPRRPGEAADDLLLQETRERVLKDGPRLTGRQELFCKEYLRDLVASEAAVRAGYPRRWRHEIGYRLVHSASVQRRVSELMKERTAKIGARADRVLAELAKVGFVDIAAFYDQDKEGRLTLRILDPEAIPTPAIQKIYQTEDHLSGPTEETELIRRKTTIKMHDKVQALSKLLEHVTPMSLPGEGWTWTNDDSATRFVLRLETGDSP